MCGIAGFCGTTREVEPEKARLQLMLDAQAHRGPDGEGIWTGELIGTKVLVGHRRLAILDLSEASGQPMISECGRYILVYNGEIYNYRELRLALQKQGCTFKTRGDTEVVLNALISWGDRAFREFNGMWALAFVDCRSNRVVLSRDRFGEKPLYHYTNARGLYFASEIKAICAGTSDRFRVNANVAARFLGSSLLQAQNETFFSGIVKVPAGHFLEVSFSPSGPRIGVPQPYWQHSIAVPNQLNEAQMTSLIRETFLDAVRIRLRSDVPVGVLLSGGLDSSAIAAAAVGLGSGTETAMISATSQDLDTNEEPFIDQVQAHLQKSVYKVGLCLDGKDAFDWLARATWFNDEPLGGFSAVAHLMLMFKARELGITVLLSGQGADELLCGYSKYYAFYLQTLFRDRHYVQLLASASSLLKPPMSWLRGLRLGEAKRYLPGFRVQKEAIMGPYLRQADWSVDLGVGKSSLQERQARDLFEFSVPSLTHYEDRMSMAASREIRLPFLDHRLVDLLLPLSPEWKLKKGWTKWIFRRAVSNMLPSSVAWRRDKKGFSNPIGKWLREEWRDPIRDLISGRLQAAELGLIDKKAFASVYEGYCRLQPSIGVKDVFNPLALEIWTRKYQKYLVGCP